MKILRLLDKIYLSIVVIYLSLGLNSYAEDQPIDIWNVDEKKIETTTSNNILISEDKNKITGSNIYNLQTQKTVDTVEVEQKLDTKEIKIIGLYDPEDFGFKIDMWSNSNGDQLKYLFSNLKELNLSADAAEIMNMSLLTNAYYPTKNITEQELITIRSDWLIKNKDLELIEEYLIKNQIINLHPNLSRYLVDQYLSKSNVSKACEIFTKITGPVNDKYLSKFKIYCLLNEGRNEEAQLILDLKKELGFKDDYFEKKN